MKKILRYSTAIAGIVVAAAFIYHLSEAYRTGGTLFLYEYRFATLALTGILLAEIGVVMGFPRDRKFTVLDVSLALSAMVTPVLYIMPVWMVILSGEPLFLNDLKWMLSLEIVVAFLSVIYHVRSLTRPPQREIVLV